MLLLAFAIKAAVFPLSAWLPDSYPTAPAPVTAVFAGLLTKVGVYAIIRDPDAAVPRRPRCTTCCCGRRCSRWSSASSARSRRPTSSECCRSPWSATSATWCSASRWPPTWGSRGAIFYIVHHITMQTTLFLVVGLVEIRGGSTSLEQLGGLARAAPGARAAVLHPGDEPGRHPAVLRLPRQGRARPRPASDARAGWRTWSSAVSIVTSLLTLYAIAKTWNRAFWQPRTEEPDEPRPSPSGQLRHEVRGALAVTRSAGGRRSARCPARWSCRRRRWSASAWR